MQEKNSAGKTRVQQFEETVADMIADRLLPKDFKVVEISEDCAFGKSEEIAVVWEDGWKAYYCEYNNEAYSEYPFVCWDDEGENLQLRRGKYLHRKPELDIDYTA